MEDLSKPPPSHSSIPNISIMEAYFNNIYTNTSLPYKYHPLLDSNFTIDELI